ncbi:hypothetical protein M8J77_014963 [Diaphorina citri]|nr:hypothetical protein M8J77_014963 [Diaphorina citri]
MSRGPLLKFKCRRFDLRSQVRLLMPQSYPKQISGLEHSSFWQPMSSWLPPGEPGEAGDHAEEDHAEEDHADPLAIKTHHQDKTTLLQFFLSEFSPTGLLPTEHIPTSPSHPFTSYAICTLDHIGHIPSKEYLQIMLNPI